MKTELVLTNEVEQLAVMGPFLMEIRALFQLSEEVIEHLNLVLEEAVSNVIFYAYPGDTGRSIRLIISKEDKVLNVEIRDFGVPYDPTQRQSPDIGLAPEDREIGGLGIFLIRQLMDEVRYVREGDENILHMKMLLE